MTSLREQLEAKARRTGSIPIQVGDLPAAGARVDRCKIDLDLYLNVRETSGAEVPEEGDEREQQLRAALLKAMAAMSDAVVQVQVTALPDDEFDMLWADVEPNDDGRLDSDELRAAFLAASCVDEELQDPAWWLEQLSLPSWSKGDKLAVDKYLLDLNMATPVGNAGKG